MPRKKTPIECVKIGAAQRLATAPLLLSFLMLPAQAQQKNPLTGDPTAIKEGRSLFRANCSPCHGLAAQGGGRGPDLTSGTWTHGSTDAAIFSTISNGVPGTDMPANAFEDSEIWTLVAYLRSVGASKQAAAPGDKRLGEQIFFGKGECVQCHMVAGRGGHLGPDLTRVGATRAASYLTDSIREPDKDLSLGMTDPNNHYVIPAEYETVTAVLSDGGKVVGVAKNEDAFSLQLLGQDDHLHLFLKKDLREVIHERRSLMPAYSEQMLSRDEVRNLVAYMGSLRGSVE